MNSLARDLFQTDEIEEYWSQREVKSYVVRVGYYPKGCWVTGTKVTKPTNSYTCYVRARDQKGAGRAAKEWTHFICKWPVSKLLVDHIRFMTPEDFK